MYELNRASREYNRRRRDVEIRDSYNRWCGEQRRADYIAFLCEKVQKTLDYRAQLRVSSKYGGGQKT